MKARWVVLHHMSPFPHGAPTKGAGEYPATPQEHHIWAALMQLGICDLSSSQLWNEESVSFAPFAKPEISESTRQN